MTQYLGEEGSKCILEAAVVISNPFNLDIGNQVLRRTWVGRQIYSKALGSNMRNLFEKCALYVPAIMSNEHLTFSPGTLNNSPKTLGSM